MLTFIVVAVRWADLTHSAFRAYFETVHGPLAERIPGLIRYRRCFPIDDPKRPAPAWDAIVEMTFEDKDSMEAAWASPAGQTASEDNANLMDLERTNWSVVERQDVIRTA